MKSVSNLDKYFRRKMQTDKQTDKPANKQTEFLEQIKT